MANLYRLEATMDALSRQFGVGAAPALPVPSPVRPGEQGSIVRGVSGQRSMHVLKWGFSRPGRDVEPSRVNLVADLTNYIWDDMVPDPRYRCFVPVSALGQPDGPKGFKTRTWFTIPEWPVFALAGFCRRTPKWATYMRP
jgi:putative SOS response-associated peptidase YedK